MALIFPINPYIGQIYVGSNDVIYIFDGVKWIGQTASDYANNAITQAGSLKILDTTMTTSSDTGALTVAGGVGIGQDLYVAGNIFSQTFQSFPIDGGAASTVFSSTSSTTTIDGGSANG